MDAPNTKGHILISYPYLFLGIGVCGSGVGCFIFAPFTNFLLEKYGWEGTNLIFAGLFLNCAIFGALMRPLQLVITHDTEIQEVITNQQLEPRRKASIFENYKSSLTEIPENQTMKYELTTNQKSYNMMKR